MKLRSILASVCLVLAGCSSYEPLDVAPSLDLARFQGKWFEIARLPRATQNDCTGTTAVYTLRTGGMDVVNECHVGKLDGAVRTSAQRLDSTSEAPSKMLIEVGGFTGDYWILEVGEHYEYAVIGHPSRDYLWILSRTPSLDQKVLDGILAGAKAKKFDTARLEYTQQTK